MEKVNTVVHMTFN